MNKLPEEALIPADVCSENMQKDFENAGAIYPKVEADDIADLMRKVIYECHRVPGTTTIVATAILDLQGHRFTLAHEHTACADPRNFNAEKGEFYAVKKASESARKKLWELEGYSLFKNVVTKAEK